MMQMRNYVIQKMEIQFNRYNKLRKWLPFIVLCKDSEIIRKGRELEFIQRVIERSIQIGNFRRAILYIVVFKTILDEIEERIDTIKKNLTDILLENTVQN